MIRSLLALTVRSLREDTRALRPHLFRLLFAGFIFVTLIYGQMQSTWSGAPGRNFFSSLCWLNFLMITVGGVSVFATPITEEKEEATLGLLRMAGINPVGLLLGKSGTRLFAAALILAIQIPFTLLAITLGGVLWPQIVAAYLSLGAYLVLVAQIGLLCSVMCSRSSGASGLSGVLLGTFLLGPWIVGIAVTQWKTLYPGSSYFAPLETLCDWLVAAAIWTRLNDVLTSTFQVEYVSFQVWTNLAAAAVIFLTACVTFDWFTRDHLTSVPSRGGLFRWRSRSHRGRVGLLTPGRSWTAALVWKEFHFCAGGLPQLMLRFVAYGGLCAAFTLFIMYMGAPEPVEIVFGRCAWVSMIVLGGIEMAIYCSRMFREELRWQTYSALMMLPGSTGHMAWSKVIGCLLAWFPAPFWLALGLWLDAREAGWGLQNTLERVPFMFLFFILHYLLFLHLVTWLSLIMKWGSLPLSFVIAYIIFWFLLGSCIGATRMSQSSGNILFLFLDFGTLFVFAALQFAIWQQLHAHGEQA